jgi:outer membrane protein
MKKILLSSVASVMLATAASAAIDVEVGAGIWNPSLSGDVKYGATAQESTNFNDLGLDGSDSTNTYIYADFSHFVPLIPNIRVEKLSYEIDGKSTLTTPINFGDSTFTTTNTSVTMEQTDIIAYWNVPLIETVTAGVVDLNFGLDIKKVTGDVTVNSVKASFDEPLPLLYLNARIDIPFAPVKLEATTKRISYDNASVADNEAKINIELPIPSPLITFSADIGYKSQEIVIPDNLVDNLDVDVKTSGLFFGVNVGF